MLNESDLQAYDVSFNEPLSKFTYTKVGGPADFLLFPRSVKELAELVGLARQTETPLTVLGNASNLIVREGGIRGLVILLDQLNKMAIIGRTVGKEQKGNCFEIEAEAGAKLKELAQFAQEQSLRGFEFACGIPGSVGGAVFMNAGAYGGEIKDILVSVKLMAQASGEVVTLTNSELNFGYRTSLVREEGLIVLSARFRLELGDSEDIQRHMDDLNAQRAAKQPLEYPSCGSVFKRPEGHFAGRLIQEAGCVGHRIGGVEVSTKHAGFMVNVDHGTATDYENLIMYVIEKVKAHSGIVLEPEVRIIGEKIET